MPVPSAKSFDNVSMAKKILENPFGVNNKQRTEPLAKPDLAELPPEQRAKKEKALYFKERAMQPVITTDEAATIAVAQKMSSWSTGPLSVLTKSFAKKLRVVVYIRAVSGIRGYCIGSVRAFDKHMNLVLSNVLEDALEWLYLDPARDLARIAPARAAVKETGAEDAAIRNYFGDPDKPARVPRAVAREAPTPDESEPGELEPPSAPVSGACEWYCLDDAQSHHGPYTIEQLKASVRAGRLAPSTMVWKDGLTEWAQLSSVVTGGHEEPLGHWESVPHETHSRTHGMPEGLVRRLVRRQRQMDQIFIKGSNVVLVQIHSPEKSDTGRSASRAGES